MATTVSVVPQHLVIIMDGNGRWAERAGLPRSAGHRAGVDALQRIVTASMKQGIAALTVFAFSSENWRRPPEEVSGLLELFGSLRNELVELAGASVCLRFIGARTAFPRMLQRLMSEMESRTSDNQGLQLTIAVGYGGRWDITRAAQALARQVQEGTLQASAIDEAHVQEQLSLGGLPEPDLLIRSGGEYRISNYLLWHLAYTELYFTDVLWPDYSPANLHTALQWYAVRKRRFGGILAPS